MDRSNWPPPRELHEVPALLNKWRGGNAQLWEYAVSHGTLLLRVKFTGPIELEVTCSGCEWVQGPTFWKNAHLTLSPDGDGYVLEDKVWEFKVRAGRVSAEEISVRDTPGRTLHGDGADAAPL